MSQDQEESVQLIEAIKSGLKICDEIELTAGDLSRQIYLELCEASSKIFELLPFDNASTTTGLIPDLKKIQSSLRNSRRRLEPQSVPEHVNVVNSPVIAPTQSKFSFKVKAKPVQISNSLADQSEEVSNFESQREEEVSDGDSSPLIVNDLVDEAKSNFQFNWSDEDSCDKFGDFQTEDSPVSKTLPGGSGPQVQMEKDNFVSGARNDGTDSSLNSENFPHSARTRQLMRDKFGIKSYRC